MLDDLSSLQNLSKFDVVLTGNWATSPQGSPVWNGEAVAETTIVGIIFLSCGNRLYWAKSGTPYVKITPQVYESRRVSNTLGIELHLHQLRNFNFQFIYSIGHANQINKASALLSSPDSLPLIPDSRTIQTGHLFTFASFDSTPVATLYAMFLAKQDVKIKRKHIWGLRTALRERLTSPLREVFRVGRIGELAI